MAGGLGLFYGIKAWRKKSSFRPLLEYGAIFLLVILPWLIWTRLVLQLPDDIIAQNFSGAGTADLIASPINFVWIRFWNLTNSLIPAFFIVYPFELDRVVYYAMHCLPATVGLVLFIPAFLEVAQQWKTERMLLLYGMLLPALGILLVFSLPIQPVLFGWQPMVGALLFFGVLRLRRNFSPAMFRALVVAQMIGAETTMQKRGIAFRIGFERHAIGLYRGAILPLLLEANRLPISFPRFLPRRRLRGGLQQGGSAAGGRSGNDAFVTPGFPGELFDGLL